MSETLPSGRCHWCGYTLTGLTLRGACPECGRAYTPEKAYLLTPWPSALRICCRIGWPLIGLAVTVGLLTIMGSDSIAFPLSFLGYFFLLAVPVNAYISVRLLLKRHLPEGKRTQGGIAVLRGLGTAVAIIVFLFFLVPLILLGACLVMLVNQS